MTDLRGGAVVGAEALLRRVHPLHGVLAPERILTSVADEAGRRALDTWVLTEAARQAKDWNDAGNGVRVAVNLAAFDQREFTALLSGNPDIDLTNVVIEVSRGQLVGEPHVVSEFLDVCRRTGLSLSLENFDGGLRDLENFERYPIESLKLDRSLVEGVTRTRTAQAIVEGTVLVARALGWRVVAKGVETVGQRDALSVFGCDVIQGYYVAHPMTAFDFGLWYGARQTVASTT